MTPIITGKILPDGCRVVLQQIMATAGIPSIEASSFQRTPAEQAAAMFENALNKGAQSQFALYAAAGDKVIQVWLDAVNEHKAEICALMEAKIVLIGPGNVSHHCVGPESPVWVVDIAPSSIPDALEPAFTTAAKAHSRMAKFLSPQEHAGESAFHLEILKGSIPT